ncbi:hypothetical protein [Micromonospora pisi]|uniref:hypothetical protein n=1 Tax=Micromonospora pisi TaxID=589240 RepID=UPI0011C3A0A8|nr:hypothetical protein [Micromonospora pisi]
MTFNLTAVADTALTKLAMVDGNRTDALNRAVRVAALLREIAPADRFTITEADGLRREIYLL